VLLKLEINFDGVLFKDSKQVSIVVVIRLQRRDFCFFELDCITR
jgi:hypothetical protein